MPEPALRKPTVGNFRIRKLHFDRLLRPGRRPPCASYPSLKAFCRLLSPLFVRCETVVETGFFPLLEPLATQRPEQRLPGIKAGIKTIAVLFPLLQSPPAGRRRRIFIRQKPPRSAGLEHHKMPSRRPGSMPTDDRDYPCTVSALATAARSTSIAHLAITQIASRPYKKLN